MVTVNRSESGIYDVGDNGFNFNGEDYGSYTGTELTGWSFVTTNYILNKYDHNKVLKWQGASGNIQEFSGAQGYAVIEFWTTKPLTDDGYLYVRDSGDNSVCYVTFDFSDGNLYLQGLTTTLSMTDNAFNHISLEINNSGGVIDFRGDGNLADGECRVYLNNVQCPNDRSLSNGNDVTYIELQLLGGSSNWVYSDAFAYTNTVDWNVDYSIGDNRGLAADTTITASLISQMELHYPTTLEPTNVKFDGETYEKYYPVCVAKINPSEDIFLGCIIKITDNLTSGGATASSVIFKGEVVKKLTKETSGFIPSYLIFSNAKEMDSIKPEGTYTKHTDDYISDVLTNLCDKLTEGTLSDGADLGTFTAAGDKSFTLIIKQCARFDGYLAYIDSSAGADNADLMYNDGSTDTGVNIDESSSTLRGLRSVSQLDEHINKVIVRGGIQADGTRAEGTASDTTSQGLYGIVPTYDTDTNLNTDALCASKAAQILADNEFGNRRVVVGYKDATKGILQPGETVTFDWDKDVHDIGFSIEQEQYIIARNIYYPLVGLNILTLFSSIYYPPINDGELLQETSHVALQNSDNIIPCLSYDHYIHLQEQQASGTDAGGAAAGTWNTRTLNTEVSDPGAHCSLAANLFTLEAGTYYISASAPALDVARHKLKLYNNSDASDTLVGQNAFTVNGAHIVTHACLKGIFTIAASKGFYLKHYTEVAKAADGLGVDCSTGSIEIYCEVELWKIG